MLRLQSDNVSALLTEIDAQPKTVLIFVPFQY